MYVLYVDAYECVPVCAGTLAVQCVCLALFNDLNDIFHCGFIEDVNSPGGK